MRKDIKFVLFNRTHDLFGDLLWLHARTNKGGKLSCGVWGSWGPFPVTLWTVANTVSYPAPHPTGAKHAHAD
jgi:hypothetical protein